MTLETISREINSRSIPESRTCQKNNDNHRANVVVFSCHLGNGHKMASTAVSEALSNDYNVSVIDTYNQPLKEIDPYRRVFNFSAEDAYNYLIQKEQFFLLNMLDVFTSPYINGNDKKAEQLIHHYLENKPVDMIISVISHINPYLLSVANELNIPLLIIPTDIDTRNFTLGLCESYCNLDYPHYAVASAFADMPALAYNKAGLDHRIQANIIYAFGYPLRSEFGQEISHNKLEVIRNEYSIQADEDVILIMMGGGAGVSTYRYAKQISSFSNDQLNSFTHKKLRIICLCGNTDIAKNRQLKDNINAINNDNHHISLIAKSSTPKIAELTSLPELLTVIAKPGGSTVNEMFKQGIPVLYHTPGVILKWERGNINFACEQGFGLTHKFRKGRKGSVDLSENLAKVIKLKKNIICPNAIFAKNIFNQVSKMVKSVQ